MLQPMLCAMCVDVWRCSRYLDGMNSIISYFAIYLYYFVTQSRTNYITTRLINLKIPIVMEFIILFFPSNLYTDPFLISDLYYSETKG